MQINVEIIWSAADLWKDLLENMEWDITCFPKHIYLDLQMPDRS
jgi:hypothetical protein